MKHGRLFVTCQSAKNIHGRINDLNESLTQHLVFKLNSTERTSRTGQQVGHGLSFGDEVLSFDLSPSAPEDLELVVELRDDTSNESVSSAKYCIVDVLKPSEETCRTLEMQPTSLGGTRDDLEAIVRSYIRSDDKTTKSTLSIRFEFVEAKIGVIKLRPCTQDWSKDTHAVISTIDGQSRNLDKNKGGQGSGFWINGENWFGDFTVQIYTGSGCIGCGKLSILSCLGGKNEIQNVTSSIPMKAGDDIQQAQDFAIDHWFLEAGCVRIHEITASDLRDVSIDSTGPVNPRIIIMSHGKYNSTRIMTNAAVHNGSNFCWNDDIRLPIVDEFTLTIGLSEDQETIGSAEISLLQLFKTGQLLGISLNLRQLTELGETLESGRVQLSLSFDGPLGVAFPQDQPTMTSFVIGQSDDITLKKEDASINVEEETFTEEAIQKAFALFDLDKNGYIGVAELKHILIMMGEVVSDEELDMMISMLDLNGDGQVSFRAFKAMVECPDPANEDFLEKQIYSPVQTHESPAMKQRTEIKREAFSRIVHTSRMDMDFLVKAVRERSSAKKNTVAQFAISYQELCDLLPTALGCREAFDLLRDGDCPTIDSRVLIMTLANFIPAFGLEEKCKLAFDMYDVERTGYLSINEIEAMMLSTNTATKDLVKKRAETFMNCADTDRSGGITIDQLIVAAEKLPTLLFPPHSKK